MGFQVVRGIIYVVSECHSSVKELLDCLQLRLCAVGGGAVQATGNLIFRQAPAQEVCQEGHPKTYMPCAVTLHVSDSGHGSRP